MKVTMNVDCTPEEARSFFGLPDLGPLQQRMIEQMEAKMGEVATAMDPETFLKNLFPQQSDAFAELQKTFWNQFKFTGDKS